MANIFKGIKQELLASYQALGNDAKKGYLWFVRESATDEYGDIYFGTRHYGHFGSEASDIENINNVLEEAGIVDESGNTVDIKTLIDEAQITEGTGVTINDGVISSTAEGTTTEDITIAGGAISAAGLWDDDVIPAGTSVQDILVKLLCTEKFPDAATKPTISLSKSASLSGLKEVYSTVTVPGVTSSTTSGKFNASYTNVSQPATNVTWDDIVFTTAKTGFTEYTTASSASSVSSQSNITVVEGTNKVVYKVIGDYSAPTTNPKTNLKNDDTAAAHTFVASSATNSTEVSVTGVYPIYVNGVSASTVDATAKAMADLATPSANDDTVASYKMPLVAKGTEFAVSFAKMTAAPYRILLPKGVYTIKTAYAINGLTGKYENSCGSDFAANGEETINVNGTNVTYTIYEWASTEGANRVKFVLK